MGKPLIMLTSITYAMKSKEILLKKGLKSDLVRTPKYENSAGCGYSLYVYGDVNKAEKILKNSGIKVLGRIDEVN